VGTIAERVRQGRTVYQVRVRIAGYPTMTATFYSRREAERWAIKKEAEMIEGKHFRSVEARRRKVADAIDRYIAEEAPQKKDASTRIGRLLWWREKIGHLKLAEVTPAVLVEYRNKLLRETYRRATPGSKASTLKEGASARELQRKPPTANRYLAYLSHVFKIARKEWHWISTDPFAGVGKFKEGPGRVRYLSEEERAALLNETAKDAQLHTMVMVALATASRAGELLNLEWRDVDLEEGRILLGRRPGQQSRLETKNRQARATWISGEALRLLKEHTKAQRADDDRVFFSPSRGRKAKYNYHDPFVAAVKAAGLEDFHFHDLRHSAATYLARDGASSQQLKAVGGWKSNAVDKYVHLAANDVKDLLAGLSEKVGGAGEKKGKDSD